MDASDRLPLWREAAVLALYVSIVILAELVALPDNYGEPGHGGHSLVGVIWGTSFGLAFAHWFAFQIAAVWFSGGKIVREDRHRAVAQIGGAGLIAVASSLPLLFVSGTDEVIAAAIAPALVLGASGFAMGRSTGRSVLWSIVVGVLVLGAGVGVAVLKAAISGH